MQIFYHMTNVLDIGLMIYIAGSLEGDKLINLNREEKTNIFNIYTVRITLRSSLLHQFDDTRWSQIMQIKIKI